MHPLKIADPGEKWVNTRGAQTAAKSRVKYSEIMADKLNSLLGDAKKKYTK